MNDTLLAAIIISLSMGGWAYFTYKIVKVVALVKMTADGSDVKRLSRLLDGNIPMKTIKGSPKPATNVENQTPDDIGVQGLEMLRKLQDPLKAVDDEINQGVKDASMNV